MVLKIKFVGGIEYFRGGPYISNIFVPGSPNIWTRGTKIGGSKFFVTGHSRKITLTLYSQRVKTNSRNRFKAYLMVHLQ